MNSPLKKNSYCSVERKYLSVGQAAASLFNHGRRPALSDFFCRFTVLSVLLSVCCLPEFLHVFCAALNTESVLVLLRTLVTTSSVYM